MSRAIIALLVLPVVLTGCTGTSSTDEAPTPPAASLSELPAPSGEESPTAIGPTEPTETEQSGSIGSEALPTAGVDEAVEIEAGVRVSVPRVRDVQIEAAGPGEVSGPGVAVVVAISNSSQSPIDLNGVAVNVTFGTEPGVPSFSPPTDPFVGTLATGATARATYAFLAPTSGRDDIEVSVEHDASENVVVVRP